METRKTKGQICQQQVRGIQKTNRMDVAFITTTLNADQEVKFHPTTANQAQAESRFAKIVES